MEILIIILILAILGSASGIGYYLKVVNKNLNSLKHTEENEKTGTVLLPVTRLDPKTECSTVLPLPMGAEICNHTMEVVTNQVLRVAHEERAVIILQCTKCGAVDKTITVTSPPPKPPPDPPPLRSECRHAWVKEKSVTLSSAFEQMEELLMKQNGTPLSKSHPYIKKSEEPKEKHATFDPSTAPPWMFKKTYIKERTCTKCGEIDRIVASNFISDDDDEQECQQPEDET